MTGNVFGDTKLIAPPAGIEKWAWVWAVKIQSGSNQMLCEAVARALMEARGIALPSPAMDDMDRK